MIARLFATGAACAFTVLVIAQDHVLVLDADGPLPKGMENEHRLDGPASIDERLEDIITDLVERGHLEASIDTCLGDSALMRCTLHLGPEYRWARLSAGGVDQAIASEARFRERYFNDRPVTPSQVAGLFEELLDRSENSGFPFASVGLDSVRMVDGGLSASVRLDRGPFVRVDSVVVKGDARISERYLHGQIGIRPGDPFNAQLIAQAEQRLKELPFITQRQRPYVRFTPERTKLYLFLDARKASSINGILGVLPDSSGRVNFTGDVELRLRNALRRGEAIDLNWRSLQDKTQDLKVRLNLPYLFRTPFGTDLSLKLFKRDTTFIEVNARAAIEYLFGRNDRGSIFVNNKSSRRLGDARFQQDLADVKLLSYGLGIERERFDYRYNPREGIGIQAEGSVGRKESTTAIAGEEDQPDPVRTTQYEVNGRAVGHLPLGGRGTLRLVVQGGSMVNELLFANELFRIGGIKGMRGVDEASIYCSSYAISTAELRFILEENSNAFVFVDQGWWEDQSREALLTDAPLGFGVGTSFETKAGIFSLTYALGRQFDNPIAMREGKVHFGFSSLF